MRSYNVTAAEVSAALQDPEYGISERPPGRRPDRKPRSARSARYENPKNLTTSSSRRAATYQVKIKDLGYTEDGAEEIRSEARLNGQPAVTLIVSKQSGQNTVAVAHEIKARLKEIEPTLPKDYRDADHRRQLDLYREFASRDRGAFDRRLDPRVDRRISVSCGISARHLSRRWRSRPRSFRPSR